VCPHLGGADTSDNWNIPCHIRTWPPSCTRHGGERSEVGCAQKSFTSPSLKRRTFFKNLAQFCIAVTKGIDVPLGANGLIGPPFKILHCDTEGHEGSFQPCSGHLHLLRPWEPVPYPCRPQRHHVVMPYVFEETAQLPSACFFLLHVNFLSCLKGTWAPIEVFTRL
jgi:hypothetical protein